ncbi:nucleoside hydrolase [Tepidimicrobium xylanilyticum]|uniref:Inosine-uridine nucleoside N-ribohydrolase n=1 Tax=Tepidimicrobium xylanilyticum TaxID=1123352 RepID=A0A1H2PZI4_9FIRM|nr:nucleoside hydrolase [Tepidimicrobium xylanilyticum]GMG95804.1 nucleoside hydrolase [Tepidimicrobium xylanilyticum]SDW00241.1 Inosine-uridine nucleoside N-ribohydrolase [Tepidimicrobium xylanilyticum]
MKKIIFDCDNTMGLYGKDVDDGLALLYLLGRKDVNLIGVTTTFGNSTIEDVHNNTVEMFNELDIKHIPLKKGAPNTNNRQSEAAEFLVEMVNRFPQNVTILATGSLTNLYGAYEIDMNFFKKVKEIVLMGGITKPLVIQGKIMNELNFSSDPLATYTILSSSSKVTILTGHICLQATFGEEEFTRLIKENYIKSYKYIRNKSYEWYKYFTDSYNTKEFYNWDIVAAVYTTNPELFIDSIENVISTEDDLKTGFLKIDNNAKKGYKVNIPTTIKDKVKFNELVFEAWKMDKGNI